MRKLLLSFVLIFFSFSLMAGNLERAFEKLHIHDYFNARDLLMKSFKNDAAAASYGLAIIYSSNNNPFYNLDSARVNILTSDSVFTTLKEKQIQDYANVGVTILAIAQLKDSICSKALSVAEKSSSLEQLNHYLISYSFCSAKEKVIDLRNEFAFQEAKKLNTAEAYSLFLKSYPESDEFEEAQNFYHERVFEEQTQSRQLGAYERFLITYPESPFKKQAERMIYSLSTSQGSIVEFKAFIHRYPENPFVNDAWREIYRISMQTYDEQSYLQFKFDFPEYPFLDELENDYKRQTSLFLPYVKNSLWGYINELGEEMIPAQYDEVNYFSEGLAVVMKGEKVGYINKSGKTVIQFNWDDAEAFHNGCAIVGKNDKFGLINKNGELLIPAEFEELSEPVENICVAIQNDKALYLSKTGAVIGELKFDIATDFQDGFAIVGVDDMFGLLSSNGNLILDFQFDQLAWASSEILKAEGNGYWGLISRVGEKLLPFTYDAIGNFYGGRALVTKNGKCGFVDKQGRIVIPLDYRFTPNLLETAVFSNGYVLMSVKDKNIILDSTGVRIQFPGYDNTGLPSEGLIPVRKNKKWGYVDYSGRLKIPCSFDEAFSFSGGNAIASLSERRGVIDAEGKWILSPTYEDLSRSGSNFILSLNGMFGLALKNGSILAPCEYDKAEVLFDQVAMLQREDSRMYVNLESGKMVWTNFH